jgi:5'-deoxynucleotidase YfbR-like HD superfamily hydrolase
MSLIVMFAPPFLSLKINITHYIKMTLIYNMAEALVRDIISIDRVKRDKKNQREEIIIDYFINSLLRKVNSGITSREIKDI